MDVFFCYVFFSFFLLGLSQTIAPRRSQAPMRPRRCCGKPRAWRLVSEKCSESVENRFGGDAAAIAHCNCQKGRFCNVLSMKHQRARVFGKILFYKEESLSD